MPAPHQDLRELARLAWVANPKASASELRAFLLKNGVDPAPSTGSINRWRKEWQDDVKNTAEVMVPATREAVPKPEDMNDIPEALRAVLSPRLLHVAQGKGLDKVEDAVAKLADAIASKAPDIAEMLLDTESETVEVTKAEDGEASKKVIEKGKVARAAVACMTQLAQAAQIIAMSRTLVSTAHRNFGEGDRLMAEADAIKQHGRVLGAKIIDGKAEHGAGGPSPADEAKAAFDEDD